MIITIFKDLEVGQFAICLEYNNEIVMSYMMGKAFFGKGKYDWEVIRGATKLRI